MKIFWIISCCLLLGACSSIPTPAERRALADSLAARHGWQATTLQAGMFDLVAYLPAAPTKSESLTIYIEGDGFAWVSGTQPSSDPSPRNPLALRLAIAQPQGNAAYLARPCQYGDAEASACSSQYWTTKRFAPEVVAASDQAIDTLKERLGARRLTLVGYSGGAAIALLVAARRNDVERLVTVAGNLDHRNWTTYHRVSPLTGSLNPADAIKDIEHIPQQHFAGDQDKTMPPILIQEFADRFPANRRPEIRWEAEFTHTCCWAEKWAELWTKSLQTGRGGQ